MQRAADLLRLAQEEVRASQEEHAAPKDTLQRLLLVPRAGRSRQLIWDGDNDSRDRCSRQLSSISGFASSIHFVSEQTIVIHRSSVFIAVVGPSDKRVYSALARLPGGLHRVGPREDESNPW